MSVLDKLNKNTVTPLNQTTKPGVLSMLNYKPTPKTKMTGVLFRLTNKEEKPSLVQKAKDYAVESAGTLTNVKNFVQHPLKSIYSGVHSAFLDPAAEMGTKIGENLKTIFSKDKTGAEKTAAGISTVVNTVGIPLNAITGMFSLASKTPVIKAPADVLNYAFSKVGEAGTWSADRILDNIPVSEETKKTLRPAVDELGAFLAQVVVGGKVMKAFEAKIGSAAKAKGADLTIPEIKKIAVESTGETTNIPVKTPAKLQIEAPKIQLLEPGILESQAKLRAIEAPVATTPAVERAPVSPKTQTVEVTSKKVLPKPKTLEEIRIIEEVTKETAKPKTEFESRTREAREEIIAKKPLSEIKDIAFRRKVSSDGISDTAHLTYLSKLAKEMRDKGDYSLSNQLSDATAGSFAAQALEAMKGEDPYIKVVREVKKSYIDKLPKNEQVLRERTIKKVEDGVAELYKKLDETIPELPKIKKFLRDNIC